MGETREGKREKTRGKSRRDRPANQTLLNFPPVSSSPDNKEGQLQSSHHAPAYHYPFAPSRHPSSSASSYPSARLVLLVLLPLYPSSRSLHPSIFSGSNPTRFDSRGAAIPPSPPSTLAASRWGQYGRSCTLDTLRPRCLITQDTFLFDGRKKGERARSLASLPGPKTLIAESGRGQRGQEGVLLPRSHVLQFFSLFLCALARWTR